MAKILILDEDALARSTLRKAFEQEGYTVSEARRIHAEDALQPWFDFEFVVIDPTKSCTDPTGRHHGRSRDSEPTLSAIIPRIFTS